MTALVMTTTQQKQVWNILGIENHTCLNCGKTTHVDNVGVNYNLTCNRWCRKQARAREAMRAIREYFSK